MNNEMERDKGRVQEEVNSYDRTKKWIKQCWRTI